MAVTTAAHEAPVARRTHVPLPPSLRRPGWYRAALAAASVWQPLQPDAPVNTALPAAAFGPDELAPEVDDDEEDEDDPEDGAELEDEPAPGTLL